jgi:TctA family transporter
MLLGFVLGPLMEETLRRSLVLSRGDPRIFIDRPIAAGLLAATLLLLIAVIVPNVRRVREDAFAE